jgi:hypothetical protein
MAGLWPATEKKSHEKITLEKIGRLPGASTRKSAIIQPRISRGFFSVRRRRESRAGDRFLHGGAHFPFWDWRLH